MVNIFKKLLNWNDPEAIFINGYRVRVASDSDDCIHDLRVIVAKRAGWFWTPIGHQCLRVDSKGFYTPISRMVIAKTKKETAIKCAQEIIETHEKKNESLNKEN